MYAISQEKLFHKGCTKNMLFASVLICMKWQCTWELPVSVDLLATASSTAFSKIGCFLFGVRRVGRSGRGDALVSFGSSSSAASTLACMDLPEHFMPASQLSADARPRHQAI